MANALPMGNTPRSQSNEKLGIPKSKPASPKHTHMNSSPSARFFRLCALAVASVFMFTQQARAQLVPIYNNFDDGNVPFGDGYPSATGGTPGWASGWTASSS